MMDNNSPIETKNQVLGNTNNLDASIDAITLIIRNQYPQLISYLAVTSVADKNTQTQDLVASTKRIYLEMLTLVLQKYKTEHQQDKNGNGKVKTGAPD
jgi:hypothetical protein